MKLEQVQKVKDYLMIELNSVYCQDCGMEVECKSVCPWSINESYAEELAREILELLK